MPARTCSIRFTVSQLKLEDCPPLSRPQYADWLAQLQAIVIEAPAIR